MRPFVVYWNNIPSPYMVDRFNALADRGAFEFEAWFNDRIETDRSWDVDEVAWRFRYRYLPTIQLMGRKLHWPTPVLGRRPDVLISLYAEPSFLVGCVIAKLRGAKTGFRVLKTHDRWVSRNFLKEKAKRFLFSRVDAIETPGRDGKQFALKYGAPEERVFLATHTVDIPRLQTAAALTHAKCDEFRAELGLKGTTFIYVGRLWWGKGVNYLLEAFQAVQERSAEEVSLLLVGDGSEEEALRDTCVQRGIRNVVFAGFQQKKELPQFYAAADVFVFPTLGDPYGIVVDEAMACSLPVISTSAAGEIRDRVEDGVNGYVVPPEDSTVLAARMHELAEDAERRDRMGKISAGKVQNHTPEQWAADFERIASFMLSLNSGYFINGSE